jgi:hypothetical protein
MNGENKMIPINYFQVVEMTDDEKMEMYMRLSKEEIAKMLIEANRHINHFQSQAFVKQPEWIYLTKPTVTCTTTNG